MRRIKGIEEGNKEAMRQTQRERYKRDKDKINAKRRERRKQKKKEQLLFMPIISCLLYRLLIPSSL